MAPEKIGTGPPLFANTCSSSVVVVVIWPNHLSVRVTNIEMIMYRLIPYRRKRRKERATIRRKCPRFPWAKTVLCMGCLACLEGWLGCLEKRTTRRKWIRSFLTRKRKGITFTHECRLQHYFWALRIENFLNIDNNNIESLKSSNLRGNYLHKSKLDTWSICEKIPDLQNTPRICSIGFVKSTFLLLTTSSEFPDAVNKVSVRQLP